MEAWKRLLAALTNSGFETGDLDSLAEPYVEDADDHLQQTYDWYFQRTMTTMRLAFGAAGALVLALLTAVLKDGDHPGAWEVAATMTSATFFAVAGGLLSVRLRGLHREYTAMLEYVFHRRRILHLLEALGY